MGSEMCIRDSLNFEVLLGNEVDETEMDQLIAEITAYRERMDVLEKELEEAKTELESDNIKKEAEELKKEMMNASMETIEVLKVRAKEAMIAVQNAVDKMNAGSDAKMPVEVDVEADEADSSEE